jgi:DNA processing protein
MDRPAVCAVLARAPEIYAHHVRALVEAAGGDLTRSLELEAINRVDIPPAARASLVYPDSAALTADLKWIETSGARLLASTEPEYPQQLLQLPDAPSVLFVLGDAQALRSRQLAMVGARKATASGCETAARFAAYLVRAGLTITSGLALGIDAASHWGALRGKGATVAVCGTGLDIIYPTQHNELAAAIRASGALVSELPPRTAPRKLHFPRRNRLISALAEGVLVVEAAPRSGSLITARRALELARPVFALPGSINNPLSGGCHQLIQAGATLVLQPANILRSLKIPLPNEGLVRRVGRSDPREAMDKGYEMLLDAVGFEPATMDVLVRRTGLPGDSIASMLLDLELEGHVAPYPGGRFGRIP